MLTFSQFLAEDFHMHTKGWMSPSGKAHVFNPEQEHAQNWHPSYRGKRGIHSAQRAGYVRFGSASLPDGRTQHFVNFHNDHPKGRATALKAMRYLKPHHTDDLTFHGERTKGPDSYEKVKGSAINEDYFSTPTLKHYSWMHHPKLGVLMAKGAYKHDELADQYGLDKDSVPRGHFVVNKNRKRTEIKPYNWHGHKADTDAVTKHLRSELKVPSKYEHLTLN